MNLKEAIANNKLDEFIKEHENDAPGDVEKAKRIIQSMAHGTSKSTPGTSKPDDDGR